MSVASETAKAFVDACKAYGFVVISADGEVIKIGKAFAPNDRAAYADCDMAGPGLFAMLGAKGGSQWGTDGGSIGGYVGLTTGHYTLNQSGCPKRVVAAVAKLR